MKLDNNDVVLGIMKSAFKESLCSSCVYSSSTFCPSKNGRINEDIRDFPHVKDYIETLNGGYIVTRCTEYQKREKKNKTKRKEFIFNPKTRMYEFK